MRAVDAAEPFEHQQNVDDRLPCRANSTNGLMPNVCLKGDSFTAAKERQTLQCRHEKRQQADVISLTNAVVSLKAAFSFNHVTVAMVNK